MTKDLGSPVNMLASFCLYGIITYYAFLICVLFYHATRPAFFGSCRYIPAYISLHKLIVRGSNLKYTNPVMIGSSSAAHLILSMSYV